LGEKEMVQYFLEKGADKTKKDENGDDAKTLADRYDH